MHDSLTKAISGVVISINLSQRERIHNGVDGSTCRRLSLMITWKHGSFSSSVGKNVVWDTALSTKGSGIGDASALHTKPTCASLPLQIVPSVETTGARYLWPTLCH